MERLRFGPEAGFTPRSEHLDERVRFAPLTEPAHDGGVRAAVVRVEARARIARHRAVVPQLLAVLEGRARVSGGDGAFVAVGAGDAVFWTEGEEHETVAETELTVLILEGRHVVPFGHGR